VLPRCSRRENRAQVWRRCSCARSPAATHKAEAARCSPGGEGRPRAMKPFQDVLWALLNSKDFLFHY
jgi:hypothetical protein